jgi:hypothetical protein
VFFEGVHLRVRFCLDHLSRVKMAAFQFYLQWGKQKKPQGIKSGDWGGCVITVMLLWYKNSLVKKEVWGGVSS